MINIPKGTKDLLPQESYKWQGVVAILEKLAHLYGFREIRTPIFEHTELFLRGVGDTTDIVNKEMYTFLDKGERSITLKPEGTAGVARSYVENGLSELPNPLNMYYVSPIFRYERPQAGRLREHHQFGVESFGSSEPNADAEVISLANAIFTTFGLEVELFINSIGCSHCRALYNEALVSYYKQRESELCKTCQDRLGRNPLRLLDCKEDKCQAFKQDAPKMVDYLCEDCKKHFEGLEAILKAKGISYKINPLIVRGLDYYTRTVFEFVTQSIGAQGTVLGGGRYDKLVECIGGKPTPAIGFGMGIERLLLLLENEGKCLFSEPCAELYLVATGENERLVVAGLVDKLRKQGVYALCDVCDRSFKAQMKYANKIGVKYLVVVGENEIQSGVFQLKDMQTGQQQSLTLEQLIAFFAEK